MRVLSIFGAIFLFIFLSGTARALDISSLAQYEAAIAGGQVEKMHPNLKMKFGPALHGTLITFREEDQYDYSSVLIYDADHPGHMRIKTYKPDQAARFQVEAAFNVFVKDGACVVFIESEGVGVLAPSGTFDLASHRGLVFCQSGNTSKLNDTLTGELDRRAGPHGIQTAHQVRAILKNYIKR